ncbi:unnamed protein product [Rhizoctonia solani]|uniref:Cuticle-degrading protease n=1 Tax=Rhizoctonia solani TaxID=456999 RepID=A0A8H2XN39_9AGAM|nr:unnamed protein product [Rhizoctonia solani]
MRSVFVLSALAAVLPALGAPTVSPLTKRDTYIIKIKPGVSQADFISALTSGLTHPDSAIKYTYSVIPAVAAYIASADISAVRGMKDVEYIEQDQVLSLSVDQERRDPAPDNESGSCPKPSFAEDGGEGVTVYGIDTGIKTDHDCFDGRATWGAAFPDISLKTDDHGHGTHTAGTVIGKYYGVARKAKMVSVKVLNAAGSGQTTDVVAGVNYACEHFEKGGKLPSIATMSLGGGVSTALDQAVESCIKKGMHFTIAAGNDNKDAKDYSPARVSTANTVGAIDYTCKKASFSNFGPALDIQAFGVGVTSAWIGVGKNDTKTISGTSMATPYVAGVLAVALGKSGQMAPEDLTNALKYHASAGALDFSEDTTKDVARLW